MTHVYPAAIARLHRFITAPDPQLSSSHRRLIANCVWFLQAEAAYASGRKNADEYAKSGQEIYDQSKVAAADAAAAAKRGAQATQSNYQSAKSAVRLTLTAVLHNHDTCLPILQFV